MKRKETNNRSSIEYSLDEINKNDFSDTLHICNNKSYSIVNDKTPPTKTSSIILKNLKKHSISPQQYNKIIINSIIFDQKSHLVSEFKNYLLWDETSEFLKRFYDLLESFDRLPNISQYYEEYTLFAPVYFGLNGLVVIIMNEWTRNKKSYLEYIEDKEEDNEKKKSDEYYEKNLNFKKLIKSNLLCSESAEIRSKSSKKTLDLTKYENVDSFFLKDSINLSSLEKCPHKDKEKNIKHKNEKKNESLSKIMDDLSSNYSVYIVNSYNIKKKEETKNNKNNDIKKKESKQENSKKEKEKDKNLVLSDKFLFSFTNLYKNRNKKNKAQKNKKINSGTSNNSSCKVKRSQINDKNKEKKTKEKNKIKSIVNFPLNDTKNSKPKIYFNTQANNLQITLNNFTRNKSGLKEKEKKEKENVTKYALTNTNVTSYYNSTSNSLSKIKIRKQKIKKLYLRNLKMMATESHNRYRNCNPNSPSSNTIDTNKNEKKFNKKNKCNLTRLLACKDNKNKNYFLNRNIINLKNFNSFRHIKINNTQINYDHFSYKANKLINEKQLITSPNSFSNNKNKNKTNSYKNKDKKNIDKNNINNTNAIINKKLSNGNLIRNLVLSQFHSKKEIIKNKNNLSSAHNKMMSCIKNNLVSRNNSLLKSKKRTFTGKSDKRLNDSMYIKPYKKELNKINLNFNFNINFNIDLNKNRHKKYLLAHKNNLGYFTQRNPIIKRNQIHKSKNKSRGCGENFHRKNMMSMLIRNMKKDYNLGAKQNIKNN